MKAPDQFRLESAIHPGRLLATHLATREMSQAECARRCGRSAKLISEIVSGKASIQPETAIQLERVLGPGAAVWLGIESDYRLLLARRADAERAEAERGWLDSFPLRELFERGTLKERSNPARVIDELLAFFGVASAEAWRDWYGSVRTTVRRVPGAEIDDVALATWLRLGEVDANDVPCARYDGPEFRRALIRISMAARRLDTRTWTLARELCRRAGVTLVDTEPLRGAPMAGAARWLTPRRALIQLGGVERGADHLWFTLFHEAAHLLFHSKKVVFADPVATGAVGGGGGEGDIEARADAWAAGFLSHG